MVSLRFFQLRLFLEFRLATKVNYYLKLCLKIPNFNFLKQTQMSNALRSNFNSNSDSHLKKFTSFDSAAIFKIYLWFIIWNLLV